MLLSSWEKGLTGEPSPSALQTFPGISPANSTPPDSNGAVSANHVVTHINGRVVVRDRNGTLLTSVGLTSFWSSLGVTDVFDPKVIHDPHSNRFIAVACAQRRSSASGMVFGVTATSDPTGSWHLWLLDADPANVNWIDFPNIGVTADRITITGNLFGVSDDSFDGINIWGIDKASALNGGGLSRQLLKVTNAGGTLVPALTHDADITTQYLVRTGTSNIFGSGRIQVYALTGAIGSLSFDQLPFAALGPAWSISIPNAKQLGTTATIETNDDRLLNAVIRNGRLWTVHTVGFDTVTRDHSAVKWWEVNTETGQTIQSGLIEDVDESGSFDQASGRYYYFPSIAVNSANEVLIGFNGSGALEHPSCYYAFRPNTAGEGLFNNPFMYKAGEGTYSGPRWGDYSHTVVDPVDDTSFWTVQQFTIGGNGSGNFWAKVGPAGDDADTTNPRVSGASATSSTTVRVSFNEAMQNNAALVNPANYTFDGGLTASGVTRLNTTQVSVTVNEMTDGLGYTVTVSTSGPTDLAGNTVSASGNTASFSGQGDAPTAVITLVDPNPTSLDTVDFGVDFSESVGTSFTASDVTVTGTLSSGASVSVSGGPQSYTVAVTPADPNGEGTIGITIGTGVTDLAGNSFGGASSPSRYTLDNTAPSITVNSLLTNDSSPPLGGTINDNGASVSVTVGGQARTATNNGNGTWTLADNALSPLGDGTYDVVATATDTAGNSASDGTSNELTIDTTPPTITVNSRLTNDNTPRLTGTVSESGAGVTIAVGGQTRTATNNGNGTWTLSDGSLNPLADGVYNVVATATDAAGNMGTDGTTNELTVDTVAPVVTVDSLSTNDARPPLTGTVNDVSATIRVNVGGQQNVPATNNGDGTWLLAGNTLAALADGVYDVHVTATDAAGNTGSDATNNELTIDATAPALTVTPLITNNSTPALSGTVDDPAAPVSVTVAGNTYSATNHGDGTWTLAENTIAPPLASGVYDVAAEATDAFGNTGIDSTTGELVVFLDAPAVTVTPFQTNDSTPPLDGTVDDPASTIVVSVGGQNDVPAMNNGDGTWRLPDGILSPLADGTYDVVAEATDQAGNVGTDDTVDELVINSLAPTVTVDPLLTSDITPPLTGTVDDPAASITIAVGNQTGLAATNNGDGTWLLPDNTLTALADGVYNVVATARDAQDNTSMDGTAGELEIDTTPPVVTVDALLTNDNRPPLSGTVNDPGATIEIAVNGETGLAATNNGDGTWTLPDNTITVPLPDNATGYDVIATATDAAGNSATDNTTNELRIDTIPPVPGINMTTTNEPSPRITGTVDDNGAAISVSVDGQTRAATNNGNGTWTLSAGQLTALADGTYTVSADATDPAGNTGSAILPDGLVVDATPPAVGVDTLITADTTPALTGTVDDPAAEVRITVDGQVNDAVNNSDGTWTLPDDTLAPLEDGRYDVGVRATDPVGNIGMETAIRALTIDTTAPVVTVDSKITNNTSPELTGTVNEAGATIEVTVDGNTYAATNNGDGTWTLAAGTIAPQLSDGAYDVALAATDALGNTGTDTTTDELIVDLTPPVVTVNETVTNEASPGLSGTVDDIFAAITVTVAGQTRAATNFGNGTWSLTSGILDPLSSGVYDVAATATDLAGNSASDATLDELTVDLVPPVVTVDMLVTNDNTPPLTGTIDDPGATVTVTVAGQVLEAENAGDGTWRIADNVLAPLADGSYNVEAVARDAAGNVATDPTTADDLVIVTETPSISVIPLATSNRSPRINGLVNQPNSTVTVTVAGEIRDAVNNGDGTWTLPAGTLSPLDDGVYDVGARATDLLGNTGSDPTSGELLIDAGAPVISVDSLISRDRTPPLTGTVSDPDAAITITVAGQTHEALNNGDGTWLLPDDTLSQLNDGVYDVVAVAAGAVNGTDDTLNELRIDTIGPSLVIGGPSVAATKVGPVSFNLHYGPDAKVGLLLSDVATFSLPDSNVTVLPKASVAEKTFPISTATAEGTISISGTGNEVRTVTVSDITGDGYLGIAVIGGSAVDSAGNPAQGAESTDLVFVDNTAPEVQSGGVANLGILVITFDEPMSDTALDPDNYTISGPGRGTLAPNPDLVIRETPERYRLVWSVGASVNGEEITITVLNVTDVVTNLVGEENTITVLVEGIGEPPAVTGVEVLSARSVAVRFSEPINTGAFQPESYTLSGSGQGTLLDNPDSISELPTSDPEDPDVTFPENRNGFRLTWDGGEMRQGGDITITVSGVEDNSGDAIGTPDSGTDAGAGIGTPPVVAAAKVITGLTVETLFSEPMADGVLDPANYTVSGAGRGTLAEHPDSVSRVAPDRYLLTWNGGEMRNGRDVTITAANVADLAGNLLGVPDSATDPNAGRDGLITVRIPARMDTTLYEDPDGALANGAGASLFAGLGQDGLVRRGLLLFDVAGHIPAGSTVMEATLRLDSAGLAGDTAARDLSLLRVSTGWSQGEADAGDSGVDGAPALPGEATWIHTSYDTAFWSDPGGDFNPGSRATTSVGGAGRYTWTSSDILADTQNWLEDADNNLGWLLVGDESSSGSVKQFFTAEHGTRSQRPALEAVYSLNGGPGGPVLGTIGDQTVSEGETLTLDLTAVDTDDNPLAITAALASLPEDHTATHVDHGDGTAQFNWTPDFVDSGSYVVTFIATQLGVSDPLSISESIVIEVLEKNRAPAFEDPGVLTATEGKPFSFTPELSDPDPADTHTYSLVSSLGNAAVDPDTGTLTWTPGFSTAGERTLRIRAVDDGTPSLSDTLDLRVTVEDANGPPSLAPVGDHVIVERETLSFKVTATDPDLDDTLAFHLENAPGDSAIDPETGLFEWTPSIIDAGVYDVTFVVTDDGVPAMSDSETVQITVIDDNQDPTDIRLRPSSVAENQPAGTVVGTLTTADPDAADVHTYTLVEGEGDTGNSQFSIAGNQLQTNATFNFEARSSYPIRVQTFDGKDGIFARQLTVNVDNVNDPPESIALSNMSVMENTPLGTAVGTFATVDEDTSDSHTYTLVAGDGDSDNGLFAIDGDQLLVNGAIDFEQQQSLGIRVRSTDQAGASVEAAFTIAVEDVNDTPGSVTLSNNTVNENEPEGTVVGEFMTGDDDSGELHGYRLVAGDGAADNGQFRIAGNTLLTAQPLDFERARFRSIRVRTSDGQQFGLEIVFEIEVIDQNDPPTDIILSAAGILGNVGADTKVSDIFTTDQDAGDTHTYALVDGEGSQNNSRFRIDGDELFTSRRVDFDSDTEFNVRIRTTDAAGAFFEKTFVLTNDDVDGDGLSDAWELAQFGSLSAAAEEDPDGDGLTNLEEFQHGTDPLNADSDGDGVPDGVEVAFGTDPNDAGDAPAALGVTPASLSPDRDGGTLAIEVRNTGLRPLNWQAEVIAGGDFVEIESAGSGVNAGTIRLAVAANLADTPRAATVRVTASNAMHSPMEIPLEQAACSAPGIPRRVSATNGSLAGQVRITWNAVPGAERYGVYRSLGADPEQAELLATIIGTAYTDSTAEVLGGSKQDATGTGCVLAPAPLPEADTYQYWVRATSVCGTGDFSQPDSGFPGAGEAPARALFEPVLPALEAGNGMLTAREDSTLAIRLRRDTAINPSTVSGLVEFSGRTSTEVAWLAIDRESLTDGWALFTPGTGDFAPGDEVHFTVSASTVEGESIGPLSYTFTIEASAAFLDRIGAGMAPIDQPAYTDFDTSGLDLSRENNDRISIYELAPESLPSAPAGATGPAFGIVPDEAFRQPQRVWIPLDGDLQAGDVTVNYFFSDKTGNETGWHPASAIHGWTVQDSTLALELDGVRYVGFLVRHGARIQLSTDGAGKAGQDVSAALLPLAEFAQRHGGDGFIALGMLLAFTLVFPAAARRNPGGGNA